MSATLTDDQLKQIEKAAKALGDRNRLRILQSIALQGCSHCMELMDTVDLTQPSVSHHIKTLVEAGLVESEKEGRFVRLSLRFDRLDMLRDFMGGLEACRTPDDNSVNR